MFRGLLRRGAGLAAGAGPATVMVWTRPAVCDELAAPPEVEPMPTTTEEDSTFGLLSPDSLKEEMKAPGSYERWHEDVKRLTSVQTFGGAKIDFQKALTPHFVVTQRAQLGGSPYGPQVTEHYQYGAQVFNEHVVAMSTVDRMGTIEGQLIIPQFSEELKAFSGKVIAVFVPDGKNDMLWGDVDYTGEAENCQLRVGSNYQGQPGLMGGLSYAQSLTPRWSLAGEGSMNFGALTTSLSASSKYDAPNFTAIGTWQSQPNPQGGGNVNMILAQYQRKVVPNRVALGLELAASPSALSQSQVTFGSEFQFKQSKVSSTVDGAGKLCTLIESKVQQAMSVSLSFEAQFGGGPPDQAGQPSDHYKVGMGFSMG